MPAARRVNYYQVFKNVYSADKTGASILTQTEALNVPAAHRRAPAHAASASPGLSRAALRCLRWCRGGLLCIGPLNKGAAGPGLSQRCAARSAARRSCGGPVQLWRACAAYGVGGCRYRACAVAGLCLVRGYRVTGETAYGVAGRCWEPPCRCVHSQGVPNKESCRNVIGASALTFEPYLGRWLIGAYYMLVTILSVGCATAALAAWVAWLPSNLQSYSAMPAVFKHAV